MATAPTTSLMKTLKFTLLCLWLASAGFAHAELSTSGQLLDRIVAVVNDGVVLQSELDRQIETVTLGLSAQGVALPPRDVLRAQVLESLIVKQLQLQRADRLELAISDDEINRSLAMVAQRNNLTLGELPAALAREGIDYARFRAELREEMVLEQLRARDVGSRVFVTRAEVDEALAKSPADDIEYEVLHILIATPADAGEEQLAAAREKADDLHKRLSDGDDFGPLAIAYSNAPAVLTNRGNLGFLKPNALPSIFAEQVMAMDPGDISAPIESPGGFHIVKLKDVRGVEKVVTEQRHARHILIQPNQVISEEQARDQLAQILERVNAGEDFADIAREISNDKGSAANGGDLGWIDRGAFVPEFELQLDGLEKNEYSQPFRTQFGWHIVQLLDRRERDATLEKRRNQAAQALRARKFEEQAQEWIRQLRNEAYVEKRI